MGETVAVSIIIAVLNSHRIVDRQLRHFRQMHLPDTVEILIMDDGSDPPLVAPPRPPANLRIIPTHDTRLWTQGLARMAGAQVARGTYLLFTDIDHILPRAVIDAALAFTGDKMIFKRQLGVLTGNGTLTQDLPTLLAFGMAKRSHRGLHAGSHGNTFLIKASIWREMGGYSPRRATSQKHTMGEDREFRRRWDRAVRAGRYQPAVTGPDIYMYPVGRYHARHEVNPFGLFHDSPRDDLCTD